jgi:hypothetical protein
MNLAQELEQYSEILGVEKSLDAAIESSEAGDINDLLKRIAEETQTEIERAIYIDKLSKKTSISKRAIKADVKQLMANSPEEEEKVTKSALFDGLIDIVINEDNEPAYLVKDANILTMKTTHNGADKLLVAPSRNNLPFSLVPGKEVEKWYANDEHQKLFEDVIAYMKRFSFTTDDQFQILACFVFLTYLQDHKGIDYMPTIYFFADPERGKTRTGKSMAYVCYRAVHCVDLKEANIFRYSDRLQSTLFFDIMDLWKKIKSSSSQDLFLLRNERGATVSRVLNPEKGPFDDMTNFNVFGATIIASNKDIHSILGTRCIQINMPNKPAYYENPSPEKATEIKARLIAWRAHTMGQPLPDIEVVPTITGRLWDISKPLLQVCKMLCPQRYAELILTLTKVAENKLEEKSESFEAKILNAIYENYDDFGDQYTGPATISTHKVLQKLNENIKEEYQMSSQSFGRKLKSLGIDTKIVGGYSKFTIDKKTLGNIGTLYGLNIGTEDTSFDPIDFSR